MLGTITVALIGLVALELFGATAGLIALILAAVYPVGIELSTAAGGGEPAHPARARRGVRRPSRPPGASLESRLWLGRRRRRPHRAGHARARERDPDRPAADRGGVEGRRTPGADGATRPRQSDARRGAGAADRRRRAHDRCPGRSATRWSCTASSRSPTRPGSRSSARTTPASAAEPASCPYKWRIFYGIPGERPLIRAGRPPHRAGDRRQAAAARRSTTSPSTRSPRSRSPTTTRSGCSSSRAPTRGRPRRRRRPCRPATPRSAWSASGSSACSRWPASLTRLVRGAPEVDLVGPAAARAQRGAGQRGDAALPGPGRPVPGPARVGGAWPARRRLACGRRVRLGDRAPVGREAGDAVTARPAELVEMRQRLA